MKKLVLDLEQIAVESFHVQHDLTEERGTVHGRVVDPVPHPIITDPNVCTGADFCTLDCSVGCPSDLCDITKAYTCPHSCGYIICIRF
jgi:hypothetical protein